MRRIVPITLFLGNLTESKQYSRFNSSDLYPSLRNIYPPCSKRSDGMSVSLRQGVNAKTLQRSGWPLRATQPATERTTHCVTYVLLRCLQRRPSFSVKTTLLSIAAVYRRMCGSYQRWSANQNHRGSTE